MGRGVTEPVLYEAGRLVAFKLLDPGPPPGATTVYRVPGSPVYHLDPACPHLATAWRVHRNALAEAVNWPLSRRRPCGYCVADLEQLRAVVREHDEHDRPVEVQTGLTG